MPNAYNIKTLRSSKNNIEMKNKKLAADLNTLREANKSLDMQIAELEVKGSNLAADLLEDLQNQKKRNSIKIQKISDEINDLHKQLADVNQKIRYPNPKEYIEEQVAKMVVKFNKHVELNKNKLGLQISTKFVFKANVRQRKYSENFSYDVPTGDMGIYINEAVKPIISSKDFPFNWMELYTERELGWYCIPGAVDSVWFESYKKDFCNMFFEQLQKKFDNVAFKLTIDRTDNSFMLNLV